MSRPIIKEYELKMDIFHNTANLAGLPTNNHQNGGFDQNGVFSININQDNYTNGKRGVYN